MKMIKNIVLLIAISIITATVFLGYMYFIGVPKTKARNYYNLALQAQKDGNKDKEIEYLRKAADYWPEEYILQEIGDLQN